jgi:spore maturation protein CgeB
LSKLKESSSVRLWEKLKYPKFAQAATRVALIDSGYFLLREMENALDRLGHKTYRVSVCRQEDGNVSASRMIEKIVALRPDFFLTVNHLGFDQEGILTSFFRSIEMPVASWYVDSPNLIVKAFRENVSPYTAVFLWDKGYIRDMESMGFESVTYLPLATDERIFRPLVLRGKRSKALACEVGFVGNSMVRPTDERMANVDCELHPVVDRLAEACLQKRASFDELLNVLTDEDRTCVDALESSARMNFEAAVLWKTTQRYRLQCIQKLCSFDLRIHGDAGWKACTTCLRE